eukprot:jgi/Mesvir1/12393/Mv00566-RA.1
MERLPFLRQGTVVLLPKCMLRLLQEQAAELAALQAQQATQQAADEEAAAEEARRHEALRDQRGLTLRRRAQRRGQVRYATLNPVSHAPDQAVNGGATGKWRRRIIELQPNVGRVELREKFTSAGTGATLEEAYELF